MVSEFRSLGFDFGVRYRSECSARARGGAQNPKWVLLSLPGSQGWGGGDEEREGGREGRERPIGSSVQLPRRCLREDTSLSADFGGTWVKNCETDTQDICSLHATEFEWGIRPPGFFETFPDKYRPLESYLRQHN